MPSKVNYMPAGYHTATPYLTVNNCAHALDFYKKAFSAKELVRMGGPAGKIGHAEIKIGDSMVMLADEMPGGDTRAPQALGGTTSAVFLYVTDIDASFKQAVEAGAKPVMQPMDMFWGDRFGKLTDPFGHAWAMATHKEDVAPEEMKKRMEQQMSTAGQKTSGATHSAG